MKWTEEETDFLVKNYSQMQNREIAKALNRHESSVYRKIQTLREQGIELPEKENPLIYRWSNEENEFLINNHLKLTYDEIGVALNRAATAVSTHIAKLKNAGLIPERSTPGPRPNHEIKMICVRMRRQGLTHKQIAEQLNITYHRTVYLCRGWRLNKEP